MAVTRVSAVLHPPHINRPLATYISGALVGVILKVPDGFYDAELYVKLGTRLNRFPICKVDLPRNIKDCFLRFSGVTIHELKTSPVLFLIS